MQKLSSVPMLNEELIQKIKFQPSPFRFFYTDDNGDEQELTAAETGSSVHPLTDEHGRWSPDQHGFGVSRTVTINSDGAFQNSFYSGTSEVSGEVSVFLNATTSAVDPCRRSRRRR